MALLILLQDDVAGVRFRIDKPRFTIGRANESDISLDDELVSKEHALIEAVPVEEGGLVFDYYLHDQESTNRCFVNDEQVKLRKLQNNDVIRIGKSNFKFVDDSNDNLEETIQLHKTWFPGVYVTKKKTKTKKKKK